MQIRGILNGTCNYILSRIEQGGISFARRAERGAAGRLRRGRSHLRRRRTGRRCQAGDSGSSGVEGRDCAGAGNASLDSRHRGDRFRIRARAWLHHPADFDGELHDGRAYVAVEPALVPKIRLSRKIRQPEPGGEHRRVRRRDEFGGHGAGGDPTAVAVSPICSRRPLIGAIGGAGSVSLAYPRAMPHSKSSRRSTVRFVVRDRPGIIAAAGGRSRSIASTSTRCLQKPGYDKSALPFVITLEPCLQAPLRCGARRNQGLRLSGGSTARMPIVQ